MKRIKRHAQKRKTNKTAPSLSENSEAMPPVQVSEAIPLHHREYPIELIANTAVGLFQRGVKRSGESLPVAPNIFIQQLMREDSFQRAAREAFVLLDACASEIEKRAALRAENGRLRERSKELLADRTPYTDGVKKITGDKNSTRAKKAFEAFYRRHFRDPEDEEYLRVGFMEIGFSGIQITEFQNKFHDEARNRKKD